VIFNTKIAIVVRDDLAVWQKLNVVVFLTSGIVAADAALIGAPYEDAAGNAYHPMIVQPAIVLGADADTLKAIYLRALDRGVRLSIYIDDMFRTGHDADNRAAVRQYAPAGMNVVGLAVRDEKKIVDKITRGATLHG
jgi:hypothetical protein